MDDLIQRGVGRGRLLRRGSRCYGIQQVSGTVERIARARAALGGLVAPSHTELRKDTMALSFPNKSRAFDRRALLGIRQRDGGGILRHRARIEASSARHAVRRGGLTARVRANWDLICRMAAKIYARGRKGSYDLVGADF